MKDLHKTKPSGEFCWRSWSHLYSSMVLAGCSEHVDCYWDGNSTRSNLCDQIYFNRCHSVWLLQLFLTVVYFQQTRLNYSINAVFIIESLLCIHIYNILFGEAAFTIYIYIDIHLFQQPVRVSYVLNALQFAAAVVGRRATLRILRVQCITFVRSLFYNGIPRSTSLWAG